MLPILRKGRGNMKKRTKGRKIGRIRADSGQHRRIMAVSAVLGVVLFVPVAFRLYDLMVVQYETYRQKAQANQTRSTAVSAHRGTIYDCNMNILACSEGVSNVYLNPRVLRQSGADIEKLAQDLGDLLGESPEKIRNRSQNTALRYEQIAAGISEEQAGKLRTYLRQQGISGVHIEPSTRRVYPYGTLAAQLIGFVNTSGTGSEGVEAAYNSYLSGTAGKVITGVGNQETDMPYSYEAYLASTGGCDVILTMDTTVQACLEKEMAAAIDRYDVQNGAFGLVMEVKTGAILAMATLGSYDPNAYLEIRDEKLAAEISQMRLDYLAQTEGTEAYTQAKNRYQSALSQAQLKQWRNRCISDGYEPGSTFKVLTLAAALDCGAVTLDSTFHCGGTANIPGRSQLLHCWRAAGHGSQKTAQALQNSCNIAFANIALSLGGQRFYEYVKSFGITEKTGIDLSGESKGVFFDKSLIVDTQKWGTASLTSGSFGQTFKLTPLQLVRAIASVVNGGYLMEPYVVSEVLNSEGKTVLKNEPTTVRQVIKEETSRTMCTLLRSVVTEGTAKNAAVYGFSVGGKTGTSEKIDVLDENGNPTRDKIVSFVGVAPMDDPEYIVLVALDTPSRSTGLYISGGVMAAPTVGAVLEDILPYLGVAHSYESDDAAGKTVSVPDFTGMTATQAEKLARENSLQTVAQGQENYVTAQIPAPGTEVSGKSEVLLYFGNSVETKTVTVPDFTGLDRQQAEKLADKVGLYLVLLGDPEQSDRVIVTEQSCNAGTQVPFGTAVQLRFTDVGVQD